MGTILYEAIKTQAKVTDSVIVGFSLGKDSIVTLDLCFRYFKNVYPYYMWLAPGLKYQEEALQKYERYYNTEIIRIPHFEVSNFLRYGTFTLADPDVPVVELNDVYAYLRQRTGAYWIAAGERITDSIVRRAMIKHSGSIDRKRGRFYPVAEWKKKDVVTYIKKKGLYLPEYSRENGYSFGMKNSEDIASFKEIYPDDYKRFLKLYPLAEVAVKRYEFYEKQVSEIHSRDGSPE